MGVEVASGRPAAGRVAQVSVSSPHALLATLRSCTGAVPSVRTMRRAPVRVVPAGASGSQKRR